jgi:phage gpG-like protein
MNLTGLDAVEAGMAAANEEIGERALPMGLHTAGERIRTAWQENIVSEGLILTGRYHDSITVSVEENQVRVESDVPYAPILEHGDSRQAAHPVAQRALEETGEVAIEDVADHLRTVLR